jgi:hypothetical protein
MRLQRVRFFFVSLCCALAFAANAQSLRLGPPFDELEARLRLNPAQKEQFDVAKAATQRALLSIGLVVLEMKGRLASELSKNRPDFESLARDPDALVAQVRPHFREARDEWARLYAMMDDDQVAIARDYMDKQFAQLEKIAVQILGLVRERLRP